MTGLLVAGVATSLLLSGQAQTKESLYAPLFEATYHAWRGREFAVLSTSIPMPTLRGASPDWLKQFDDVPVALRTAASQTISARPKDLQNDMPAGVRTIAADATHTVKARIAFSDALVTPDGLDALVYYEARCGSLCGEGGYAWLRRESVGARWSLKKKIPKWFS
jgi:hypothetical protein